MENNGNITNTGGIDEREAPLFSFENIAGNFDEISDELLSVTHVSKKRAYTSQIIILLGFLASLAMLFFYETATAAKTLISIYLVAGFVPHIMRIVRREKAKQQMRDRTVTMKGFYFFNDRMEAHRVTGEVRRVPLPSLVRIMETDKLIALVFNDRIVYSFGKEDDLSGIKDEFCRFIERTTGKKTTRAMQIKFCTKYYVSLCITFLLMLGAAFAANTIAEPIRNALVKYTYGEEYSVMLPKDFKEAYNGEEYVYLTDGKAYLATEEYSDEFDGMTLDELYEWEIDDPDIKNARLVSRNIDSVSFDFTMDDDGETYYILVSINMKPDGAYYSEFCCMEKYRNEYEKKFAEWADTIEINYTGSEV